MHSGEADARRGLQGVVRGKRRRTMSDQAAPLPRWIASIAETERLVGGLQRRSKRREKMGMAAPAGACRSKVAKPP